MNKNSTRRKSCDPQLLEQTPQKDWGVEQLGKYAQAQHQAIEKGEQSLAPYYWRLGLALELSRKHFAHHQWAKFLDKFGIDKTRASKARAIHRTFSAEQETAALSVQQAYAQRKRNPRKPSPKKRSTKQQQPSLLDWAHDVCRRADDFLAEAQFVEPRNSSVLLPVVDAAIEELTKLRERLRERSVV
jgi:hypothetical protein